MSLNTDLNRIRRDGWTVIEGIIPEDEVDAIRDHVLHSTGIHGRAKAAKEGIGHVPGFIRYDQSLAPYLADARLMALSRSTFRLLCQSVLCLSDHQPPGQSAGQMACRLAV